MRISLRTKLAVYASLLVLGVVSGVGFSTYLAESRYLMERLEDSQKEVVKFLAQVSREAYINQNQDLIPSYLSILRWNSRLFTYAMVLDKEGRVKAHSNNVLIDTRPRDPVTLHSLEYMNPDRIFRQDAGGPEAPTVDLSLPITLEGRRIGTARVGYSLEAMRDVVHQALRDARRRFLAATLISLGAGLALSTISAFFLSRPIRLLRDGARVIGQGDLSHRIRVTTRDELGDLAEEFNIMAARLEELDQLKQDFVSNVTHELRSPLTSLRGYVEFLLRGSAGSLNDEQRESLIVVKNNAVRLSRFIDNLLDVAKIEAGKLEIHPEPVSLRDVGQEMIVVFRPQTEEKNLSLLNEIPADLSRAWVDGDRLLEIMTNLVSNAFKFTPDGGRVTMKATEEGDMLHVTVADTGLGIAPQHLRTVFNKFEQVKPTKGLVRKTRGTGLGLTIVKGFVEAHGGRVWIDSEVNQGTTVHFTLPKGRPISPEENPPPDEGAV